MVVRLFLDHLWSHVKWSSFERSQNFCLIAHVSSKPKITQFDGSVRSHKDILRLHISMRDAVTVNITKSPDQLLSYFSDFVEVKRVIILNNVEQLALSELSNKNEF